MLWNVIMLDVLGAYKPKRPLWRMVVALVRQPASKSCVDGAHQEKDWKRDDVSHAA